MKKKNGRPSKFNSALETIAIALAEKGNYDRDIADIIGVSESALNEHKKRNPSFHESMKKAKAEFDESLVEQALLKRAIGCVVTETQTRISNGKKTKTIIEKELPPDATSLALYLRNRNPERWSRDKQNISVEVESVRGLTLEEAKMILAQDPFNCA